MASAAKNSSNHNFLQEVTAFIEDGGDNDVSDDDNDDADLEPGCDEAAEAASSMEKSTDELSDLQKKINEVKLNLDALKTIFDSLKEKRVMLFEDPIEQGKVYLSKIKSNVAASKSEHKKDGDGIEAKLFAVL